MNIREFIRELGALPLWQGFLAIGLAMFAGGFGAAAARDVRKLWK